MHPALHAGFLDRQARRECMNATAAVAESKNGSSIRLPGVGRDMEQVVNSDSWAVERRSDGAVLVRVPSDGTAGVPLPDAVFAFRAGDPQFTFWDEQLRRNEGGRRPGETR